MTNHPNRAATTIKITAIYRRSMSDGTPLGDETFAAYFEVPRFKTNGVDSFPETIEMLLVNALRKRLHRDAQASHHAAGLAYDPLPPRGRVLAFYTDRRAKALIERFPDPIEF